MTERLHYTDTSVIKLSSRHISTNNSSLLQLNQRLIETKLKTEELRAARIEKERLDRERRQNRANKRWIRKVSHIMPHDRFHYQKLLDFCYSYRLTCHLSDARLIGDCFRHSYLIYVIVALLLMVAIANLCFVEFWNRERRNLNQLPQLHTK